MKATFCILVWVIYCIITILYFGTFGWIEPMYSKIGYLVPSIALLIFCIRQILTKMGDYTKAFIALCLSALAVNMLFILLYHLFGIEGFKFKIITFIGLELFTAASVFICGKRHGLFKNE